MTHADKADEDAFTDPSDWPWPGWQQIDAALRCGICREFLNAPVTLACDHSFCSLCLRSALDLQVDLSIKQCPQCRQSMDLQRDFKVNGFARSLVTTFLSIRAKTLEAVCAFQEPSSEAESRQVGARSRTRNAAVHGSRVSQQEPHPIEVQAGHDTQTIACPICEMRLLGTLQEAQMHVDSCLSSSGGREPADPSPKELRRPAPPGQLQTAIKKPWFGGMKDQHIRQKLASFGLASHGDRKALTRRYGRYVNEWNALCDEQKPFRPQEVVDRVRRWEQLTVGRGPSLSSSTAHSVGSSSEWTEKRHRHLEAYADEFNALIKRARGLFHDREAGRLFMDIGSHDGKSAGSFKDTVPCCSTAEGADDPDTNQEVDPSRGEADVNVESNLSSPIVRGSKDMGLPEVNEAVSANTLKWIKGSAEAGSIETNGEQIPQICEVEVCDEPDLIVL